MQQSQNIFSLIQDQQEKTKILETLVRYSRDIKIKSLEPRAEICLVSPRTIRGDLIFCKIVGTLLLMPSEQEVIVQFNVIEQNYISQVRAVQTGDVLELDFSGPLYKVQRREDFRLRLPGSFRGSLTLSLESRSVACKILDISAGGCRIEIPSYLQLNKNDKLKGTLSITMREDLPVDLQVRHLGPVNDKENIRVAGLQFTQQTEIVKNRMAALVMDLYREFFTKRT